MASDAGFGASQRQRDSGTCTRVATPKPLHPNDFQVLNDPPTVSTGPETVVRLPQVAASRYRSRAHKALSEHGLDGVVRVSVNFLHNLAGGSGASTRNR